MMIDVRNDVIPMTAGNQIPWEDSSLTRQYPWEMDREIALGNARQIAPPTHKRGQEGAAMAVVPAMALARIRVARRLA
jgi:hypothetical protein